MDATDCQGCIYILCGHGSAPDVPWDTFATGQFSLLNETRKEEYFDLLDGCDHEWFKQRKNVVRVVFEFLVTWFVSGLRIRQIMCKNWHSVSQQGQQKYVLCNICMWFEGVCIMPYLYYGIV